MTSVDQIKKKIQDSVNQIDKSEFIKLVEKYGSKLQSSIIFARDEYFDYFGLHHWQKQNRIYP